MSAKNMQRVFTIKNTPTTLYFGINSISYLGSYISKYERIGVIASKTGSRVSGALKDVMSLSEGRILYIVDGPSPNPSIEEIDTIINSLKTRSVDAIISIGGGSVIDSSKVVSVALANNLNASQVIEGDFDPTRSLPLFAINLTHGTGSEVDAYSVVNIPSKRLKIGLPVIYPIASFDDPRYTLTLPRKQIICTSLDALYHALESVTTNLTSPFVQMLSEEATRLIVENLPLALENPKEISYRYWLLYASALAGISIDYAGVNVIHALEHGLSAVNRGLEHGCGLGIIGPDLVKRLYVKHSDKLYRLLRHINPTLRPIKDDADLASRSLREFQERVGLRESLRNYGFNETNIYDAIESAWGIVEIRTDFYSSVITKEETIKLFLSLL